VPGAIRIELAEQIVARMKIEAVVGLHAKYELDSETVEPGSQDPGYPSEISAVFRNSLVVATYSPHLC
jgi:hypothetical protein